MSKVIVPKNRIMEIKVEDLLENAQYMKHNGLRLSQACAAWINNQYELSYSFVDENTYAMITLRLTIDLDTEVPSIGAFFPYAVFYENEMEAMYGVHMRMMGVDYHTKWYRTNKWAAMLPEDVRQEKVAMRKEKSAVPGATEQPADGAAQEIRDVVETKSVPLSRAKNEAMAEGAPKATVPEAAKKEGKD